MIFISPSTHILFCLFVYLFICLLYHLHLERQVDELDKTNGLAR